MHDTRVVDICHFTLSKFIEYTRINPKVKYVLWVMMMSQCRFVRNNKCTALVGDADRWGVVYAGQVEQMGNISFAVNLKFL